MGSGRAARGRILNALYQTPRADSVRIEETFIPLSGGEGDEMSSGSRRVYSSSWILAVGMALVLSPVASASALGTNSFWRGSPGSYYGGSWNGPSTGNGGAQTARQLRDCGMMGAQAMYRPYPGASLRYSNCVYHSSNAIKYQTGTVGGKHYNSNTSTFGTT